MSDNSRYAILVHQTLLRHVCGARRVGTWKVDVIGNMDSEGSETGAWLHKRTYTDTGNVGETVQHTDRMIAQAVDGAHTLKVLSV